MKKTLLILAISALAFSLNAYVPMLKKGYEWTYVYTFPYIVRTYRNFDCYIVSDTVMNGYTYYRFAERSHLGKIVDWVVDEFDNYFLREDTVAERVYILDLSKNRECLLYDFSVQPGDSVEVFFRGDLLEAYSENHKELEELIENDPYFAQLGIILTPLVDSATYARIHITNITTVTDSLGNSIRKYDFSTVRDETVGGRVLKGSYYERYGCPGDFLFDYNSFKNGFCGGSLWLRCGLDDMGMVGWHRSFTCDTIIGSDCFAEGIKNAQTASPQAEEIKTETLPEENPSNEEETPVEKKPFKSKNLKRCTLELEKYHSKK